MTLSHLNDKGRPVMVDVGDKPDTRREAVAQGEIRLLPSTLHLIDQGKAKKGDVLATAQIAGIMAAKNTANTIPMCHNISLTAVELDFHLDFDQPRVLARALVRTQGKTGAEMEALNGVATALLTIYDMCKSADKTMEITGIRLIRKTGGKSGDFIREGEADE